MTKTQPCPLHHHDDPDIQQRITVLATQKLHHLSPSPQGDLRCSTINANTLTEDKLNDIIALITTHAIDIMFITDTRCNLAESRYLQRTAKRAMGPSSTVLIAPTLSPATVRVGGQLVLVTNRFGLPTPKFWKDPSDLGLVTTIELNAGSVNILFVGTYWPVPTHQSRLDDKPDSNPPP
jgi:hypothetical protein